MNTVYQVNLSSVSTVTLQSLMIVNITTSVFIIVLLCVYNSTWCDVFNVFMHQCTSWQEGCEEQMWQSLSSLLLYAWISSCHSSPTSSSGHNMPHWDALIKSQSCQHNLTFPFLFPAPMVPRERKTNSSITPSTTNNNNSRNFSSNLRRQHSSRFTLAQLSTT